MLGSHYLHFQCSVTISQSFLQSLTPSHTPQQPSVYWEWKGKERNREEGTSPQPSWPMPQMACAQPPAPSLICAATLPPPPVPSLTHVEPLVFPKGPLLTCAALLNIFPDPNSNSLLTLMHPSRPVPPPWSSLINTALVGTSPHSIPNPCHPHTQYS